MSNHEANKKLKKSCKKFLKRMRTIGKSLQIPLFLLFFALVLLGFYLFLAHLINPS